MSGILFAEASLLHLWSLPSVSIEKVRTAASPKPHLLQLQVSHDLQLVNADQVLHAVFVVQQVVPIHCQFKLVGLAQDDHLRERKRERMKGRRDAII